ASMMSAGVFAGAARPNQDEDTIAGNPSSAKGGTCGRSGERVEAASARALSLPARTVSTRGPASMVKMFTAPGSKPSTPGPTPAIGDVDDIDAGLALEQLTREMDGAARARRRVGELARLRPGERDELGERVRGQRSAHHEHMRGIGDQTHESQIRPHVEAQVLHHCWIDREARTRA